MKAYQLTPLIHKKDVSIVIRLFFTALELTEI